MEQQKDMLTKRWRGVQPPRPSELQVHISVMEYVRVMGRPGVVYFHVPNGELRDKRAAAKLKAMGVLPGVADLVFIRMTPWSMDMLPTVLFLEIKAQGKKASEAQAAFCSAVKNAGCHYAVADNLDDAIDILERHGMVRPRHAAGRPG